DTSSDARLPLIGGVAVGGGSVASAIPVSLDVTTMDRNNGRSQIVSGTLRNNTAVARQSQTAIETSSLVMQRVTTTTTTAQHTLGNETTTTHYSDPHASTFDVSTDDDEEEDRSQHQPTLRHSTLQQQQHEQHYHHVEDSNVAMAPPRRDPTHEFSGLLNRNPHRAATPTRHQDDHHHRQADNDHDVVATVHSGPQVPLPSSAFYNDDMKEHVMADPRWLALQLPLSSNSHLPGASSGVSSSPYVIPSASSLQAAITPILPSGAISIKSHRN
ncbi:Hypothetical protein, putative, partial [Bodo saltans]